MEDSILKVRIAGLWILMAVAMSVHSILLMLEWVETVDLPEVGEVLLVVVPEWVMGTDLTITLFMMSLFLVGSVVDGVSICDLERFGKPLGKYNSGHSLYDS